VPESRRRIHFSDSVRMSQPGNTNTYWSSFKESAIRLSSSVFTSPSAPAPNTADDRTEKRNMAPRKNNPSVAAEIALAHLQNCLVNLPPSLAALLANANTVSFPPAKLSIM
jgi:hypothetical protein